MKTFRPNLLFLFCLCLFASCATSSAKTVTMNSYLQVQEGKTRQEVLKEFGEPVSIEVNDEGMETFTYIEYFSLDERVVQAKYYYFYFKNDKLIGKAVQIKDRPQSIDSDQL